jgi:hypothetical protein
MSSRTSAVLVLSLFLIVAGLLVANGLLSNFAPEKQAAAKVTELAAQSLREKAALDLKYEDLRRGIMEKGLAQRDLKIEMDKAENLRIGELNTLTAKYEAAIAAINTQRDLWRAVAAGGVILVLGISIALVLCAFAYVTHMRNKAQVVSVGSTSIVLRGDQMFQPENSLDRYTAIEKIPRWAKALIWIRIAWSFNPKDGDEERWKVVERARRATEPHVSNSQVEHPQEVAQLRQAQLQLDGIRALARKMNSKEARDAAGTLTLPKPAESNYTAPQIGWLPEAAQPDEMYKLLEMEAEK